MREGGTTVIKTPGRNVVMRDGGGDLDWLRLPRRLELCDALLPLEQSVGAYSALQTRLRAAPFRENMIRAESRLDALSLAPTIGIEGDLLRLLILESTGERPAPRELRGAVNAIDALEQGLACVRTHGRAGLTLQLLSEMHRLLCAGIAVSMTPGTIRQSNPGSLFQRTSRRLPSGEALAVGLDDLERFLTDPPPLPLPVRLALVAAHVELLSPFDYGSGQLAWLLLPLMAVADGLPPLFLARTLSMRQDEYDRRLQSLQSGLGWEEWTCFFLARVTEAAITASARLDRTERLQDAHGAALASLRSDSTARRLSQLAMGVPALTVGAAQDLLDVSFQTANSAVATLVRLGLLRPHSANRRNRVFILSGTLEALASDRELVMPA